MIGFGDQNTGQFCQLRLILVNDMNGNNRKERNISPHFQKQMRRVKNSNLDRY